MVLYRRIVTVDLRAGEGPLLTFMVSGHALPAFGMKLDGSGRALLSKKEVIEEKAWALLSEETAARNLIPVDAEYVRQGNEYSLLLYIDKEGGVTVEDCEAVSRALDPKLDEEDFIPDAYTLYVSSPGLGRPIRRPRDYVFAKGKSVELRLFRPVDGQKEYEGILTDFDEESATLDIEGQPCRFMKSDISLLRLAFDF